MPGRLDPEHAEALELCHVPTSVAEVAAHLKQPVMVTKVILSDLIEWEAYYRGYQEWKKRYTELQQWSGT